MSEFYAVKEIAKRMKVTKQTVFDWIDKGMLPAIKVGRTIRIKEEDFNNFLNTYYHGSNNKTEDNNI